MSNIYKNYNPDILETIANLSNDEVFTPPKVAREMLDMLPKEVWSNPNLTFLDPAVKTGIFLREITSRLIEGLADEIPDLQERVNHILTKQVFGIGITELTTLMSRRTLYCSMTANGAYSICTEFDNEEGNILFPDTEHDFNEKTGRCEDCGANRDNYENEEGRENYAYSFIHKDFEEVFGNMKFDVIIGNPPYQLGNGGGAGDSAVPIYHNFVRVAMSLDPKYISMITPSKWMRAGSMKSFRNEMISDNKISHIVDYINEKDVFPSLQVDGGISYFLIDKAHEGKSKYIFHGLNNYKNITERYIKNDILDIVIRDNRQYSIIEKVIKEKEISIKNIVSLTPFGFKTDLFNNSSKYGNISFLRKREDGYSKVFGVEGRKGGAKRVYKFINNEHIKEGVDSVDKYKLFFSGTGGTYSTIPSKTIKGYPGDICTGTFLKMGDFATEEEMENCYNYSKTKFFRALFFFNRVSFGVTLGTFDLIPLQDFSKPWTDSELYAKYKLTEEEIAYIEDNIESMGDQDDLVDLEEEEFED